MRKNYIKGDIVSEIFKNLLSGATLRPDTC